MTAQQSNGPFVALPVTIGQLRAFAAAIVLVDLWFIVMNILIGLRVRIPHYFVAYQFNMDSEAVLGAWYPSALLLVVAFFAFMNYNLERLATKGMWPLGWLGIAAISFLLSMDEVAAMHERVGLWFQRKVGGIAFLPEAYAWVLALAPFILAVVVFYILFFLRQLRKVPLLRNLGLIGLACWINAIVFESIAQTLFTARTIHIERAIEESSELLGTTLFLIVFAILATRRARRLRVS